MIVVVTEGEFGDYCIDRLVDVPAKKAREFRARLKRVMAKSKELFERTMSGESLLDPEREKMRTEWDLVLSEAKAYPQVKFLEINGR